MWLPPTWYVLYSSMYKMVRSLYKCPQPEMLALLLTERWLTGLQGTFLLSTLLPTLEWLGVVRVDLVTIDLVKGMGHGQWFGLTNHMALDYACKTLKMKTETLNLFFTLWTERSPCMSGYWSHFVNKTWPVNQVRVTNDSPDQQFLAYMYMYLRSWQCNVIQFWEIVPCPVKLYIASQLFTSAKLQQPTF